MTTPEQTNEGGEDEMPPLNVVYLAEHGTCSRCGSVCPTCATFTSTPAAARGDQ